MRQHEQPALYDIEAIRNQWPDAVIPETHCPTCGGLRWWVGTIYPYGRWHCPHCLTTERPQ